MIYAELKEPAEVGATVYVSQGIAYLSPTKGAPGVVQSIQGKVALIKPSTAPVVMSSGSAMGVTVKLPITAVTGLTITHEP